MDAGGCWVYPASGIPVGRRGRYTGVDLNKKATPTAASMVATFERGKDYISITVGTIDYTMVGSVQFSSFCIK